MSCPPTPCPPAPPTPVSAFTSSLPSATSCGLGFTYYNSPQTYVSSCPPGSPTPPISVTIPAFTYSSLVSQQAADDQAMAAAEASALAQRAANPCQDVPPVDDGFLLADSGDFLITESSDFLVTN